MHEFFPFNFSLQEYILFTSLTPHINYSDHYLLRREHLMTFNLHVNVKEAINMFLDMETNVQTIATVLL